MTDREDLFDLVAEGRAALAAPAVERVHACLVVLPKIVEALDRVAMYQLEMRDVRKELTIAIGKLREEVRQAQAMHPEVTYRSAQVRLALVNVTQILDKLDRLIYGEE